MKIFPASHTVATALTQLQNAELVRQTLDAAHQYSFKHVLVQDTAYASLLKHERKLLHRLVARTIRDGAPQQLDENAARLAEHYWNAEEWQDAAGFSLRAGNGALRVYAMREAIAHFERALAALEKIPDAPREQSIDALLGWAHAAEKFRPYAEQLARLTRAEELARALDDKPRLARALYGIGGVRVAQGHGLSAYEPLSECFRLANELGDERLTITPTYFMGLATLDTNPRDAIPLFERAIELAQRYQDADTEAVTWSAIAWARARSGEFENANAAIARGQALLPRVQSPMVASDVDLFAGWAFLEMGDTTQGESFGRRGLDKARAADNFDCVCGARLCIGFNQLTAQDLARAQESFRKAIRESQFSGAAVLENMGQTGLAMTQLYSGQSDALAALERAHARAHELGDGWGAAAAAQTLGEIRLARGELERAEAVLADALAFYRRTQTKPALARTLDILARVYDKQTRAAAATHARAQAAQARQPLPNEN